MPLNRRQLVTGALVTAAAATSAGRWAATATAAEGVVTAAAGGHYSPNAAPLHPTAFLRLPPGRVTARGWLAGQLRMQLDGLCGQYEKFSHFLDFGASGWVRPDRGGWEEVPYWLRGYTDLAIVTGDTTALAGARRWIDAILTTQQSDGFFGPKALRTSLNGGPDFWPFLPLVQALRSWQEYDGDNRIIPFLSRFFRYMNAQGPGAFDTSWIALRWGDGLDSVYWLFNRTGDTFLLDLADKIHRYGADWGDNLVDPHNVNIAQGFREPAQYCPLRSGSRRTPDTYGTYAKAMAPYGQFPGGGFAGDENARPGHGDPRQGFETCGIVEFMASHQLLTRTTGDPLWADRCEELAFNSLPASLDPSGKAVHYVTSANSVDLDDAPKRTGSSRTASPCRRTCRASTSTAAARTTTAWAGRTSSRSSGSPPRTADSPRRCTRRRRSPQGRRRHGGDLHRGDRLTRSRTPSPSRSPVTEAAELPPGACGSPPVHRAGQSRVNGRRVTAPAGPAFTRIERTWSDGDKVTLRLPQHTTVRTWRTTTAR